MSANNVMGRCAGWGTLVALLGGAAVASAQPPVKDERDPYEDPARRASQAAAPESAPRASATQSASSPTALPAAAVPRVHHAPLASASPNEPLEVSAQIDHPHRVKTLGLVYRNARGQERSVPFQRAVSGGYVAVIPSTDVQAPTLAYTMELEDIEGTKTAVFASRAEMQPVQVMEDRMDARERGLFERLGGRRSVVTISTDVVRFGETTGTRSIPCAPEGEGCQPGESKVPSIEDQYWRVEAGYTYRFLRTVAEFSLRAGVVRGTSLVPLDEYDEDKYDVGLNYGSPSVRFRLADSWHLETLLLTSVTEVGFSVGTGGALLIGNPYGSRLTLGFETIGLTEGTYFGTRLYSRMDIAATERFLVAPILEVTDMPHAESFGVRLLAELGADLGRGFGVAVRGGYQARRSTSGGPAVGGQASLAF